MMRTWTLRGFLALIAAAAVASALHAAPPEPVSTDDMLRQVLSQLQDVTKKLNTILSNQDLQIQAMDGDVARLKADVARLSEEVKRLSATTNIAASINPAAPVAPGSEVMGNVVLDNRWPSAATVVVNGRMYRVNPFDRVVVSAPVGRFRYSVYTDDFGLVQAMSDRFLTPGRDFPITIHP